MSEHIPWAEHLAWCKQRALEFVEAGDVRGAFSSMTSDLGKHPRGEHHPGIELGMSLLLIGDLKTPAAMRDFIEGFN